MRSRAFMMLLVASTAATCGYSLLLPVVPLWAARGGAGAFGAGLGTAVLMLTTVSTQAVVPWLMRRVGHRLLFGASLVLLGAPAPLLGLSDQLGWVLGLSAVRGLGFGAFVVVGNALVPELVAPAELGRATARFGMAIGVPQLVLLPAGVGLVGQLGFEPVFVAAAAPLLGLLPLPFLPVDAGAIGPNTPRIDAAAAGAVPSVGGARADDGRDANAAPADAVAVGGPLVETGDGRPTFRAARWWRLSGPLLAMVLGAMAQGGLITFLPLTASAGPVVPAALFGSMTGSLLGRLVAGHLVDARGLGGRLVRPGLGLTGFGMLAELTVVGTGGPVAAIVLVAGAVAVGVGFGLVQNDSLVTMFAAAGRSRYSTASAAWNAAYDTGTGVGALGLGALAQPYGLRTAFGAAALLVAVATPFARPRR